MGSEHHWQREIDEVVGGPHSFVVLVRGATSLEPIAELLQPQRRSRPGRGSKRHLLFRPQPGEPTVHITARYSIAAQPLLPLVIEAYVSDLDRLARGRDTVGELRFGSRKLRSAYLSETADVAVPDPAVTGSSDAIVPVVRRIVPPGGHGRLVFLVEVEPHTIDPSDWLKRAAEQLPDGAGLAVAVSEMKAEPPVGARNEKSRVLVFDRSHDPAFQRPKRGDRPVRAALGVEPKRLGEFKPPLSHGKASPNPSA